MIAPENSKDSLEFRGYGTILILIAGETENLVSLEKYFVKSIYIKTT